jgi:membrane protease YdiL (CAAX protease family)
MSIKSHEASFEPVISKPVETSLAAHWVALALVLVFPTAAAAGYFALLSGGTMVAVVYSASKVLQFAFPLAWVVCVQRQKVRLALPDVRSLGWGLAFGVAAVAAGLAAYSGYFKHSPYLAQTPERIGEKVRDWGLTTPLLYWAFALFLAVPHALLEEYYWRWFACGQLRRVCPEFWAVLISSLGFMAHHVIIIRQFMPGPWGITLLFSGCVALGGAVWAVLYLRGRSLYGPWISHLLLDCGIMFIGYDLVWGVR